jgi:UDP-3-O-[3-hydroxymyristoyl] glucosamine N-acyltransferase
MEENVAILESPGLPVEPAGEKKSVVRTKRAPKHDFKDGNGRVFAHRHDNGKGWVADTAKVDDACYIGPRCSVFNFARVTGAARLEGTAKVHGHAVLQGAVSMNKSAQVYGRAVVRDSAQLHDNVAVLDHAVVSSSSRLFGVANVSGSAQVIGTYMSGAVRIMGSATVVRSHLRGDILLHQNCVAIHATMSGRVIVGDFAQVLHSTLSHPSHHSNNISVRGYAVVADQSHVMSAVEIKDHSVVARSAFHNLQPDAGQSIFLINGNIIVSGRQFYNRTEADEFVALMTQTNNGQNVPPAVAIAQGARRPAVTLEPTIRRVMRLEEAVS